MDGTLKFVNYKVGGTQKTPTALLKPNFFVKVLSFLMLIKPEGMTQFDTFHTFVENSVNSELLIF